ncbi:hypothetical protein [Kitasatospora camelliae]|uniref:Uncharacterized protein n=1 Tax=Kitasatospora camelliae TaxID=3156397 RepID=A0AAU8K3S1_9ACTN
MVNGGRGRSAGMVWAFVVHGVPVGPPVAEAVLEVDGSVHAMLAEDAQDSGFTLAAGDPPETTAVVRVRGRAFTRLVLVGDRQVWEPTEPVPVSPAWLAAAEGRGRVVVTVVPPGTWPRVLPDLPPEEREEAFTTGLAEVRAAGLALHGTARVVDE